jgi:hypothetical protein
MSVGVSRGRPFSHRQVALVSGWPNCQGWIVCDGAGMSKTRSGWRGVELGQIVQDEVEPYAGAERLGIEGPCGVLLSPKTAVDLALVVHELPPALRHLPRLQKPVSRNKIAELTGGKVAAARRTGNGRTSAWLAKTEHEREAAMATLPLAMDIVDTVEHAAQDGGFLHVDAAADALIEAHPEADVTSAEVGGSSARGGRRHGRHPAKAGPRALTRGDRAAPEAVARLVGTNASVPRNQSGRREARRERQRDAWSRGFSRCGASRQTSSGSGERS